MHNEWVFTVAEIGIAVSAALTVIGAVMFLRQVWRDRTGPPDVPSASH